MSIAQIKTNGNSLNGFNRSLNRVRNNERLVLEVAPDLYDQFLQLENEVSYYEDDRVWYRHFPIDAVFQGIDPYHTGVSTSQEKLEIVTGKITRLIDRHERRQERRENSFVDLDDITEDIPEPIPGLPFDVYPNSIVLIYGMSQNRKSYLALHLAARMAEHGENVVIYQNEGSKANTASRLKAWQAQYPDSPTNRSRTLKLLDTDNISLDLSDNQSVDEFIDEMQEYSPSMIVIDALTGAYEGEENSNTDLRIVMDNVRYIKDQLGAIVVLIDNTGKDKTRGARGAQAKFDKADTVIFVETKEDRTRTRYDKQRFGEKRSPVSFIWIDHTIQQGSKTYKQIAPMSTNVAIDAKSMILDAFEDSDSMIFTEIKKAVGLHDQIVTNALKELVEEGSLVKSGRKYILPDTD
jgi:hypothetical protein